MLKFIVVLICCLGLWSCDSPEIWCPNEVGTKVRYQDNTWIVLDKFVSSNGLKFKHSYSLGLLDSTFQIVIPCSKVGSIE